MTFVAWMSLAVAVVLAGADWFSVAKRDKPLEYVFKPATMVALIAVAFTLDPVDPTQRLWFVAALALSLGGDVFLMLPDRFLPGVAAFAAAHLAYLGGLWPHAGEFPQAWAGSLGVVVISSVLTWVILPGVRARAPGLVVPILAYVAIISLMVATAGATLNPFASAGALLFYASDGLIAWTRFVGPVWWAPVTIMATYHGGQALLVLSLALGWGQGGS